MSSEANYSFTTKINGDLFTVRGDSFEQFHAHLAEAVANAQSLITDIGLLQASGHATPVVVAAAPAAPATPPPAPVQAAEAPIAPATPQQGWGAPAPVKPMCTHGPRTGRSGHGAKGEWRAYFCPTAKGTPGQCEPEWVKKGSPQWNNFVEG